MTLTQRFHRVKVTGKRWLTQRTFEIRFGRPDGFDFLPGQKIGFIHGALQRDYTLLGPAHADEPAIVVRLVPGGRFSPVLAAAGVGDTFTITSPFGFFTYKSGGYPDVWVAAGTGVAPFVAFVRAGIRDFLLLHGVRQPDELCYADELGRAAGHYVPCISAAMPPHSSTHLFPGRVSDYLAGHLAPGRYDFYLCGPNAMVRDGMRIIDERFDGSRVFSEIFY